MSNQIPSLGLNVESFFPPDEDFPLIESGDFRTRAGDTTPEIYTTRILELFKAACSTAPGINSVLSLYQPFYEAFVDRNRRFHRSTDEIKFLLNAIYVNDKEYGLYDHIVATDNVAPVEPDEPIEPGE